MTAQTLVTAENWDEDFEFGQTNSTNSKSKDPRKAGPIVSISLEPRLSIASSHFSDWDADDGRKRSPKATVATGSRALLGRSGITSRLDSWAEPGPSTPTKKNGSAQAPAENWDDDFEDKADSPPSRRHHTHRTSHHALQHHHTHSLRARHSYHTPPRPKPLTEPENWDDDFDDPTSSVSPAKTDNENTPVVKRSRREAYADSSDEDDEVDFGFSEDKEEDKTVTAHARTAPMTRPGSSSSHLNAASPPPPVPVLPHPHPPSPSPIEPFPRSPSVSVFSIPTTSGRNSIGHFNSTSHLVLSCAASSLGMLPPSPPTHRERRRLRKKSRPPHIDNNVFELIEEQRDSSSPPLPPSTPERASSPPMVPMMPSSSLEATPSGGSKTPLLARIGSVKKWGVRRKRASTGPSEMMMMQDFASSGGGVVEQESVPRPPSSLEQTQMQSPSSQHRSHAGAARSTWFFRPGGAHYGAGSPPPGQVELKHEKSLDQARLRPGVGAGMRGSGQVPTTPSKGGKLSKRKASGIPLNSTSSSDLTGDGSSAASGVTGLGKPSLGPGRRPSSMQVPNGVALAVGTSSNKFSSVGTRHASYGSSFGRASSSRVFSTPTPTESAEDLPPIPALPPQEGSRSFMGNVRKISLVSGKKHKKKSVEIPPDLLRPGSSQDDGDPEGQQFDADGDAIMQSQSQVHSSDLLPPIELHPPSPPRPIVSSRSMTLNRSDETEPVIPSTSAPASITMTPITSPPSNKATPKTPSSPQSASLGRATQAPNPPPSNASVPRRNSLGDLKIPARISQAQIGLKRDLGMVREFATNIDRLKEFQLTYHRLLAEVQTFLENAPPSRATSPTMFSLVRPRSRQRSNTSPPTDSSSSGPGSFLEHRQIAATLHAITIKYRVSWECAELLIELGGGSAPSPDASIAGPSSSVSAPIVSMQAELDRRKNRERAITLSGEDSKPPFVGGGTSSTSGLPNASWRASTGRHDLSQRQLVLLRDMLNGGEVPADDVPVLEENVNRTWRWGDAMGSTVTLPSEESGSRGAEQGESTKKKRRSGRVGLTGLRDMLRMLKRSHSEQTAAPVLPAASTASLSTNSSHYSHHYPHGQLVTEHIAVKTSTRPKSAQPTKVTANSPYNAPPLNHKSSPRRPSLASIFRIGQRSKASASESSQDSRSDVRSASRGSNMTGDDEDWDRIETAVDLDMAVRTLGIEGTATIRGRKVSPFFPDGARHAHGATHRPVTPRRMQDSAALRLEMEASPRSLRPMRSTRLSNVEEVEDGERQGQPDKASNRVSLPRTSPNRPPSRGLVPGSIRTGSVRSAPPLPLDDPQVSEIKLSMTPENIKPLLENAKEVHVRCYECIRELRALLDATSLGSPVSVS